MSKLRTTGSDVRVLVNNVLKRNHGRIVFKPMPNDRYQALIYQPGQTDPDLFYRVLEVVFTPDGDCNTTSRVSLYGNPVAVDFKTCRWLVRRLSEYQVMMKLGT